MIVNISEKVIVITGSSRGIGRELAKAFAKENAYIVINYHNDIKAATELYNEIHKYNENCLMVQADVTNRMDVAKLYNDTLNKFGKIDVLINNAGICEDNLINLMSEKQWRTVLDTNLTGAYLCSKYFSKAMILKKTGKIINIASLKGQEGHIGQINYSASKAGLIGFTKALAKELGEYGIAVNAVCPGFIVTDLNRHNRQKKEIAKERSILPIDYCMNDLINYLIFMSSDKFMGISGRVINLDSRIK